MLGSRGELLRMVKGLKAPTGVAVLNEQLYVTGSTGSHEVARIPLYGSDVEARAGGLGFGDGELQDPQAVVVAQDPDTRADLLLVPEWENNRVSVFTADFEFVRHIGQTLDADGWPEEGSGPGQLNQPCDVAVHGDELFVADTWNHRISVFALADGAFRRSFGVRGKAPGEFTYPCGIATDHNHLYVAERSGKRLQVLSLDGEPLQVLPSPCGGWLYGVCIDAAQRVWVTGSSKHALHIYETAAASEVE